MGMKFVKLVEVGPRDGLQNEAAMVPTEIKIDFIQQLAETGLSVIEATSFVSPKWIPQLADAGDVFRGIVKKPGVSYPVLVPNTKGLDNALAVGATDIAVFTTPSEQFSQKNTGCSVAESMQRIAAIMQQAKEKKLRVRGYISCVLGCPYEGEMQAEKVAKQASELFALGCHEISLGDTIGVGTPSKTKRLIDVVSSATPIEHLAVHFHDTYGQALANIYVALQAGISVIDSAVAGLGGCPYAKGASGNVATEDVLYMLNGMNIKTGVNLEKLVQVGRFIVQQLNTKMQSKVNLALSNRD
jgi:hydroxymethylglutaryl-CoA lyase